MHKKFQKNPRGVVNTLADLTWNDPPDLIENFDEQSTEVSPQHYASLTFMRRPISRLTHSCGRINNSLTFDYWVVALTVLTVPTSLTAALGRRSLSLAGFVFIGLCSCFELVTTASAGTGWACLQSPDSNLSSVAGRGLSRASKELRTRNQCACRTNPHGATSYS